MHFALRRSLKRGNQLRIKAFCLASLAFSLPLFAQNGPINKAPDITKVPTLYVVPYAHLDTQWRWEMPQTISEYLNERYSDETASRILAAYRCDIVETSKGNPVVNPEKKNLKHLESEQNHLYFAVCREMLLCHSRPLSTIMASIPPESRQTGRNPIREG
jgi:hypothetical protein